MCLALLCCMFDFIWGQEPGLGYLGQLRLEGGLQW